MNFAIKIPNSGLVFGIAILFVATLALTSGNNLLYLILSVLIGVMVVSWIAAVINLGNMRLRMRFPEHIFTDESVRFDLKVVNNSKYLPAFSVDARLYDNTILSDDSLGSPPPSGISRPAYFALIKSKSEGEARFKAAFSKRGIYKIPGFELKTSFPFGFIEHRRFIEAPIEIAVYPKIEPIEGFHNSHAFEHGNNDSSFKGFNGDLYAIRPYQSSDHHKHIDWKSSAKTGKMMIREYTKDENNRLTVVFDPSVTKEMFDATDFSDKFERAVTYAASIIDDRLKNRIEVRLITPEFDSGYGSERGHLYSMFRQLAEIVPVISDESMHKDELKNMHVIRPLSGHVAFLECGDSSKI